MPALAGWSRTGGVLTASSSPRRRPMDRAGKARRRRRDDNGHGPRNRLPRAHGRRQTQQREPAATGDERNGDEEDMAFGINTNIESLTAQRNLTSNGIQLRRTMATVTAGMRI